MAMTSDELKLNNNRVVLPMVVVGGFVVGIFTAGIQYQQIQTLREDLEKVEHRLDARSPTEQNMERRLARIEAQLESIAARLAAAEQARAAAGPR